MGVQISGQWSEKERTFHINVLELLVIKLTLFSFTKGKREKTIHFQIEYIIGLSKEICHYLLNHSTSITAGSLPLVLNAVAYRESRKKNRLFRVASSSPSFWRGFSITAFFENRSISFSPMPTCRSLVTETINKWCTLARVTERPHHGWGQEIENSSKLQPLLWLKMHCLRPDVYDPKAKNWIYFIYFKMVIGLLKNQWHILKFTNKNQQWNLLRVMATNWCQTFTKI